MKNPKFIPFSLLTVGLTVAISAPLPMFSLQSVQAAEIAYKPTVTTAPVRRVGAGSRGLCKQVSGIDNTFALQVLAPESIGDTISAQPTLYWSVSKPLSGKFNFTVVEDSRDFTDPVLDTKATLSVPAGIQTLSLAKYQVSLKKGVKYKWSVSLECDTNNPSLNIVTTGMIKLVEPAANLDKTNPEQLPFLYAKNGYWYDALNSLSNLIQANPTSKKWLEERASLLKQGGLDKVAYLDK